MGCGSCALATDKHTPPTFFLAAINGKFFFSSDEIAEPSQVERGGFTMISWSSVAGTLSKVQSQFFAEWVLFTAFMKI